MTKRAFVLGLLLAAFLCSITYLNDWILRQTFLIGNHMPVSVYGPLMIFLLVNALVFRLRRSLALSGKEIAVILAMVLAACSIPGSGLMRTFPSAIMLPHYHNKLETGWKKNRLIDEVVPERMLASVTVDAASGTIKASDGLEVTLDDTASEKDHAYSQMRIRVSIGKKVQVRRILKYSGEKRVVTLAAPWALPPPPGTPYRVLKNNEEEALTPYIQGQFSDSKQTIRVPFKGSLSAVNGKVIGLGRDASPVDKTYVGMPIIMTIDGRETEREIVAYSGDSRTATVDKDWGESLPEEGTRYQIDPRSKGLFSARQAEFVIQSVSSDTVGLDRTASNVKGAYCDMVIAPINGQGRGQRRRVVAYDGGTRVLNLDQEWSPMPAVGDLLMIDYRRAQHLEGKVCGAEPSTVMLSPDAGRRINEFAGMTISIVSGKGHGQARVIASYDPATQTATLKQIWDVLPDTTSVYRIVPKSKVAWGAWSQTLSFWIPVLLALFLALIGLSLLVHRQWSRHEHLPYPIAQLADSLLPSEESVLAKVFRDRRFWIAAGIILAIYANNYIQTYYQDQWFRFPTRLDLYSLVNTVKLRGMMRWTYGRPIIYFTAVAIAYFLASDVSLSVGIAPLVYGFIGAKLADMGLNTLEGGSRSINHEGFFLFGAYFGMTCMIAYTGRHYYLNAAKRAVWLQSREEIPSVAVWGLRALIVGTMIFVGLLTGAGLQWSIALMYAAGILMMFLVMGRIIAETGMFFIQTRFVISSTIIGLVGPKSLGIAPTMILLILSAVLAIDPRETLMPFLVNSAKLLEFKGAKLGRATIASGLALVLALAVAIPCTLYYQYNHGANLNDGFGGNYVPKFAFNNTLKLQRRLQAQGHWEGAGDGSGSRFPIFSARPMNLSFLSTALIGAALVIATSFLRLRWNKWPFHPIIFLIFASYANAMLGFSFLLGWLIKTLVLRFGGSRIYQDLKPVFIGLVAGEFLGALIPIVVGFIYYLFTGDLPKQFTVFPG